MIGAVHVALHPRAAEDAVAIGGRWKANARTAPVLGRARRSTGADRELANARRGRQRRRRSRHAPRHRVLYAIARVPGICAGDLAASLGITRQAIHRPLVDLHRRRLVLSTVSAESARERELRVTLRGAELEDKASGAQREQLRCVFSSVGPPAAEGWVTVIHGLAGPIVSRSPGRVAEMVNGQ
jgi:DNA-binding MarR family transcriptional regulator